MRSSITSREILDYAFEVIYASSALIPCKCALVECSDEEKVLILSSFKMTENIINTIRCCSTTIAFSHSRCNRRCSEHHTYEPISQTKDRDLRFLSLDPLFYIRHFFFFFTFSLMRTTRSRFISSCSPDFLSSMIPPSMTSMITPEA